MVHDQSRNPMRVCLGQSTFTRGEHLNRGAMQLRLAFVALLVASLPGTAQSAEPDNPIDYMIVVTGTELLTGVYPDGHTHFLTRTLHPLGLHCVGSMTVDDKPADIGEALRYATERVSLVIVTGGLGPTDNDVTREALARFTGIALEEHPDVLADMERRFRTPRDELRPNLRGQARVPKQGGYLKNANGTSVGLVFDLGKRVIIALPGPPRELQPMVRSELAPYLNRRFGARLPGCSITLRFVGLGQSQIDHTIEQHVAMPDGVSVASQFEGSRVDFTFTLPNDTAENRARLEELKAEILKYLGANVYATDGSSLEEQVARRLAARSQSLALAEAASGGGVEAAMSGVAAAGQILAGGVSAPTEEKLRILLRIDDDRWQKAPETARVELLAAAVAEAAGSSWALAVGEVRPGPSGNPMVAVAFRSPDGRVENETLAAGGTGELARANLVTQLVDRLRRRME